MKNFHTEVKIPFYVVFYTDIAEYSLINTLGHRQKVYFYTLGPS